MTPLARACRALRLPAGLYCLRGEVPLSDAEIRANLRRQHVGAERLVLALADVGEHVSAIEDAAEIWPITVAVVCARDLPASMVGVLALLAVLPQEGSIDPDELGLWVEAAP
jgi:hypothetical protein